VVDTGWWRACEWGAELWVREVQQGKEFHCGIILLVKEKTAISRRAERAGKQSCQNNLAPERKAALKLSGECCEA